MDTTVLVAIITASSSIVVAALTFFLTKRYQLKAEWQQQKLDHYRILLSSLSDLATDGKDKYEANLKLAMAVNTMALVAPQYVIDAWTAFHDEVEFSNPNKSTDRHDYLLSKLLLAIRCDIGLSVKDNPKTFSFHLIGSAPPEEKYKV